MGELYAYNYNRDREGEYGYVEDYNDSHLIMQVLFTVGPKGLLRF